MPDDSIARLRLRHTALALLTIVAGLAVHLHLRAVLGRDLHDIIGDATWAAMMVWWVSAVRPQAPLATRAGTALAISVTVEFGQLLQTPALDAIRATLPGHLVLGSGFDPRDIAAYVAGVLAAAALDRLVVRRRR
jgi:hypothetical protein